MKQSFYKLDYPLHKPAKEGEYLCGNKNFHFKDIWEGDNWAVANSQAIHWFFEPVPEVKGAEEYLNSKNLYASTDVKDVLTTDFIGLKAMLEDFAQQLQKLVSEEKELIREVIMRQGMAFPETEQDLQWSEQKPDQELMLRLFEYLGLGEGENELNHNPLID